MDELIEKYVAKFGKMPPADAVISFYDPFYQMLIEEAVSEGGKEITPEVLEREIGNKPYDDSIANE